MANIHFPSGRPYYKFVDISRKIAPHFDGPISSARMNKVSISFNDRSIADVSDFTAVIARYKLENNVKTLALFKKAILVSKDFMSGKLEGPYACELNLGKLLPVHLMSCDNKAKADAFLSIPDHDFKAAYILLREMDAVIRDYDWPIHEFTKYLGWTMDDVNKLTEKYFGTAIKHANDIAVLLEYGGSTVNSNKSLAEKIFEKSLEKEGRTLCLFQKAMYDTILIAFKNSDKKLKFTLDISLLTPRSLFRKGINTSEIDDIIDDQGYKKTIKFIFDAGALDIEGGKITSSDNPELPLKNLPELFYPE